MLLKEHFRLVAARNGTKVVKNTTQVPTASNIFHIAFYSFLVFNENIYVNAADATKSTIPTIIETGSNDAFVIL